MVPQRFGLVTLHRPSNVDDAAELAALLDALRELAKDIALLFPVHPRTREQIKGSGLQTADDLRLVEPLGYLDFLGLVANAALVITDSGGIQEETSFLDVPCVTVRDNTERPITLTLGSNVLAGRDPKKVLEASRRQLSNPKSARRIPLWDGHAAERIVGTLVSQCLGVDTTETP